MTALRRDLRQTKATEDRNGTQRQGVLEVAWKSNFLLDDLLYEVGVARKPCVAQTLLPVEE